MLDTVSVALPENGYDILIGPLSETAARLRTLAAGRRVLAVADTHTIRILPGRTAPFFAAGDGGEFVFPAGEASKTFATAAAICAAAARQGCDRRSLFVALGGGVVGDLTGFAAAIYMRGVDFVQVPTSLLAMVDSSVGGKTGVDLPEGKNLAGAFHQPRLVLIDPAFLRTLPMRERVGALAEVIKYGVILDGAFFSFLEQHAAGLTAEVTDPALFGRIIRRCCELKAAIVVEDEQEHGRRALLNYGHTFGHAVELLSNFSLSHGESVAIGMAIAGRLAVTTGFWSREDELRQNALLRAAGLPVRLPRKYNAAAMLEIMRHDKKCRDGRVVVVLPCGIGRAQVVADLEPVRLMEAMEQCHD